jgi:hypothetical protein
MIEIVIASPSGPIRVEPMGNGEEVVPGTGDWGIDSEGKVFHDPAGVPASEAAYLSLDSQTGAPVVIHH